MRRVQQHTAFFAYTKRLRWKRGRTGLCFFEPKGRTAHLAVLRSLYIPGIKFNIFFNQTQCRLVSDEQLFRLLESATTARFHKIARCNCILKLLYLESTAVSVENRNRNLSHTYFTVVIFPQKHLPKRKTRKKKHFFLQM